MRHPARLMSVLVLVLALAGCGDDPDNVVVASFEGPTDAAFVCVDVVEDNGITTRSVVPLSGENCVDFDDADVTNTQHLHALVTQSLSGELAAIDMDGIEVLDNNLAVPGFTFVTVGEKPSGIVIRPDAPQQTYISSFGARTLQALDTESILNSRRSNTVDDPTISFPAGPVDLVASSDGTYLYAAIKENGTIEEVRIEGDGQTLTPTATLTLDPTLTAQVLAPPSTGEYAKYCSNTIDQDPVSVTTAPRQPVMLGIAPAPSPNRMRIDTLDEMNNVLLIADASLPLIHRYQLSAAGASPLPSINVGVPVTDIALTPPVPANLGDTTADQRYLYAIDATDGTLLVVDYAQTSPTFGAVLPVFAGAAREGANNAPTDRIRFGRAQATAVEVISPEYDPTAIDADSCDPASAAPNQLRGVFVSVGLSDGTLAYLDVFDLDANCRGGTNCENPTVASDLEVRIRRHRPRSGSFQTTTTALIGTPSLRFNNNPGQLDATGQPTPGNGPGLATIVNPATDTVGCPTDMRGILQTSGLELICVSSDPWTVQTERWTADWQGAIPGTSGGLGTLVDNGTGPSFSADNALFCNRGVMGTDDIAASALTSDDPEFGYSGDQLVITAEILPTRDSINDPDCGLFVRNAELAEPQPLGFEILSVSPTTLTLGDPIAIGPPLSSSFDAASVTACFGEFMTYEVRTKQAYTVSGSTSGFVHRVVDDAGACRIDAMAAINPADPMTFANGRAQPGVTYVNPSVAFSIEEFQDPTDPLTEATLIFDVSNPITSLRLATGTISNRNVPSLPTSLIFLSNTDELFIVDTLIGLGRIDLQDNSYSQYFR